MDQCPAGFIEEALREISRADDRARNERGGGEADETS
jgi:hypothetical protein